MGCTITTDIIEINGKTYRFEQSHDEWADSPEAWGRDDVVLGETTCSRGHWSIGDKCFTQSHCESHYADWGTGEWAYDHLDLENEHDADLYEELRENWESSRKHDYEIFPVRLLDFGSNGAELRMCDDDRATGYILVKVEECLMLAIAAINVDAPPVTSWDKACDLLETWNMYLQGDVYVCSMTEVSLEDEDGNEHYEEVEGGFQESCGGIYGWDAVKDWKDEMVNHLRSLQQSEVA